MSFPFGIEEVKRQSIADAQPVVLCLCKNEDYLLDAFFIHYRKIGFRNFVFLDNGSTDGTIAKLTSEDNTTLLSSTWSYKENQTNFKQTLISTYGQNRWSLIVDADEFLALPLVPPGSLNNFLAYLDSKKYNAVFTPLLDMFSKDMFHSDSAETTKPFDTDDYPLCSFDSVQKPFLNNRIISPFNRAYLRYYGGMRQLFFGIRPALHKFALTKHHDGNPLHRASHYICEGRGRVADTSGILMHYKFTPQFHSKIDNALIERQYYNNSSEYEKYYETFKSNSFLPSDLERETYIDPVDASSKGFGFVSRSYVRYSQKTNPL